MKQQQPQQQKNFLEVKSFLEMIDNEVKKFIDDASNYYIIEKAKKENYFGSLHSQRDLVGLLGYLRMNFAVQIRTLKICNNFFPIDYKFYEFLTSQWFKNEVLKNNFISHKLHFKGFNNFNFNFKIINNFT